MLFLDINKSLEESHLGQSLSTFWSFSCIRLLPNSVKSPFPVIPVLSLSAHPQPYPSSSQSTRRSLLFPLPKEIHMFPPWALLASFSGVVDCSMVILYSKYPFISECTPCLHFCVWVTSLRMIFFLLPSICLQIS